MCLKLDGKSFEYQLDASVLVIGIGSKIQHLSGSSYFLLDIRSFSVVFVEYYNPDLPMGLSVIVFVVWYRVASLS